MRKQLTRGFGLIELMIALSLSTLIMLLLFHLFVATKNMYLKQRVLADMEDRMRFISLYLGEQIHVSGDWSCASTAPSANTQDIRIYDENAALHDLGLTIKSGTNLLQLTECVRLHHRLQFLPVLFFVADTHRITIQGKNIDALFFKIEHHPREELIPGISNFQAQLLSAQKSGDHDAVLIQYVLTSIDDVLKKPRAYWFLGHRVFPDDLAFYQAGVLCAVKYAGTS